MAPGYSKGVDYGKHEHIRGITGWSPSMVHGQNPWWGWNFIVHLYKRGAKG